MRNEATAGIVLAAVMCAACGSGPTAPTGRDAPILTGEWNGALVDSGAGSGALRLIITQQAATAVVGSWTLEFEDASLDDRGTLGGAVDGPTALTLFLKSQTPRTCDPLLPPSPPVVAVTLTVNRTHMTGHYDSLGCGSIRDGTVDLARR
jgi:hypothetical protein